MNRFHLLLGFCAIAGTAFSSAITITIDYRFDERGFFDDPLRRVVLEAAAARWSRIVDQKLLPVNMTDGQYIDGRFGIRHPETGERFIFSAAASPATDFTYQATGRLADEYLGGFTLEEDEMIVFVGSRPMAPVSLLGLGGTIQDGGNLAPVYDDPQSFLNRGFNQGRESLPVMGGFIAFDADREWNFDLSIGGELADVSDFYSVALHELGHTLGLNSRAVAEWSGMVTGGEYTGENAVEAYNADNGTNVTGLKVLNSSARDYHWAEERYVSRIFPYGSPLYVATAGPNALQELLMESAYQPGRDIRLEVTNVDAAALRDLGWSVIDGEPPRPPVLPVGLQPSPTGKVGVAIPSKVGKTYVIQTSPDGVSWVDVYPPLIGDGGPLSWSDGEEGYTDAYGNAANLSGKFFRVIEKN